MLNQPTMEKMRTLRLDAMATAWTEQQQKPDAASLGFDERLGLLVDAEWLARENKRLCRYLKEARAPAEPGMRRGHRLRRQTRARQGASPPAGELRLGQGAPEHFDYGRNRHRQDVPRMRTRTTSMSQGLSCLLPRASRLFDELHVARADGFLSWRLLAKIARMDVLIVDDWAMRNLKDQERHDFWEVSRIEQDKLQRLSPADPSQQVARLHG